jgi:hypothetical protein
VWVKEWLPRIVVVCQLLGLVLVTEVLLHRGWLKPWLVWTLYGVTALSFAGVLVWSFYDLNMLAFYVGVTFDGP